MDSDALDKKTRKLILSFQQDEVNSHIIYKKLAKTTKDEHNARILEKIAEDELKHYKYWKKTTNKELKSQRLKILLFYLIARLFGLTFGIRLMERGEKGAQKLYLQAGELFPNVKAIIEDEERHESELVNMLNEELLEYVGSVVLGLSDALVELTGALAGFTFALQNTSIIALAGFVAGISAAFSMAASEYLSTSEDDDEKSPLKAALYTGLSYLITVIILILPYILLMDSEPLIPLVIALCLAVVIIFVFTFYISVAKEMPFKRRFLKVAGISLGVAFISLCIGLVVRMAFNIEI